jgi:hypothetical protein
MKAGRGKLKPTKKDKSPVREPLPLRSPFDEFKLSPGLSNRRRLSGDLLPGLPDKTPRRKKDKSPLIKDPKTKEGTVEVPGLGSLLEKSVDERHQSNHFGDPPLKEHLELPSEEKQNKSIESSSTQTGAKGLDSIHKSVESSSIQTGTKGLDATDPSRESSSSQEGNRSLNDKETEAWKSNKKFIFDEKTNGPKRWGDLSDTSKDDNDKGYKGSNVTAKDDDGTITEADNFNPNDPSLYNRVPMQSNLFATEQVTIDPDVTLPGTGTLPTSPSFKDGREWSFVSEKECRNIT